MKVAFSSPYDKFTVVLAENLNPFFSKGDYTDILQLEEDVAQIAGLIVLFSESFGSAAELGAFAMMKEVAANLLVIIDSKNFNELSFISLGPLRSLRNRHGDGVTCVLPCVDLGIEDCTDVSGINLLEFNRILASAIPERFKSTRVHTTFDRSKKGHLIKFILGLINHYGSLTFEERDVYLFTAEITVVSSELKICYYALSSRSGYTSRKGGLKPTIQLVLWIGNPLHTRFSQRLRTMTIFVTEIAGRPTFVNFGS